MSSTGFETFTRNIRNLPRNLKESLFRHGSTASDRGRSQAVFSNLFLHVHATRTHKRTLRFNTTMAMGIASLALFLILTGTGILLMVYYKPGIDQAYDSIKDIHYVIPTGRFIRNIHRWAAHLMVVTVILHLCRVFYTASYKKPREFNWLLGLGLFIITLALSFSGYLLPWDQLAFWAITIGSNIAGSPTEFTDALGITSWFDPGSFSKELLLGASEVGQEALLRFYLLHCIVLPLALTVLLAVHFWRIRKDGGLGRPEATPTPAGKGADDIPVPTPPSAAPDKSYGLMCVVRDRTPAVNLDPTETVPSWPCLLRAELLVFVLTMLLCVVLGLAFDAPLKEPANPDVPENPAKAPWYFLGIQEMTSYSGFMGGMIIPMIIILGLGLIPFLDREKEKAGVYFSGKPGKIVAVKSMIIAAILAIAAVAVPVNFGWLRNWFPDVSQLIVIFVNPGTLLTAAYAAWSIYVLRRTQSTRMAAMALFTCFIVGFVIMTIVGTYLRGPNWDFYWSQADWPAH